MMIVLRLVYGSYEWQICTQLLRFMLFELGIWVIRASGKSVRRFNFFDSFCFNRIHCNFHYWAFDRLIWLRHTSSQQIYVSFWFFWQRYVLEEFIVIFIIELGIWVLLVTNLYAVGTFLNRCWLLQKRIVSKEFIVILIIELRRWVYYWKFILHW